MRIIHCADLHLDSKMNTNLDKDQARERKRELLNTYEKMISYAAEHKVEAIVIAGDLFDTKNISAVTRNIVLSSMNNHPDIRFYYLKGNHDNDNFLSEAEEIPENLRLFDYRWKTYEEADGHIAITGVELSSDNADGIYRSLVLDADKFNIVVLHGQESASNRKDKAEIINLKELRNKGIDYLALGHIHGYKKEQLDPRAAYCYCGCLEGRGFDECGDHGFVLLDIDEKTGKYTHEFIRFAGRKLYTVDVDVTDSESSADMVAKITLKLQRAGCEENSLVKIVLKGMLDVACEKDVRYIYQRLKDRYYFVKVYDETTLKIDIRDYLLDESLKGEFVRLVMKDPDLTEEERKNIVRYGLQALTGEEV